MGEDRPVPPRDRYLDETFGERGYLSKAFPGYRPRAGQIALAEAVDGAIGGRKHLFAEGPTGTGKSLAYAAPATWHASRTGRPVVIVTANIALQEQIVEKDLPLLQSLVPWPFTFALMKGRNNYLCIDRYLDSRADEATGQTSWGGSETVEERRQLPILKEWARASIEGGIASETGDVSELPFEPMHALWKRFSVGSDECKKSRCKYREECFSNAALDRARRSMVVVTNYHMLFAHLAVFNAIGYDAVLPPFEVAILDEAHKAADIARDFFGFKITTEAVRRLGRKLKRYGDEHKMRALADRLDGAAEKFFHALGSLRSDRERYKANLVGDYNADELHLWDQLRGELSAVRAVFDAAQNDFSQRLERLKASGDGMGEEAGNLEDRLGDIELDVGRSKAVYDGLASAMKPDESLDNVFYLEEDEKRRVSVCSKLVHPGKLLRSALFDKHVATMDRETREIVEGPSVTVIATSATLAEGKSFAFAAKELGAPRGHSEMIAESPFDWKNQAIFVVPEGMPEPNDPTFKDAVARNIQRIIGLAGGRTLCLFTSRRVLEHTYESIGSFCRSQGIRVLKQGDAPRTKLVEEFKSDVRSVLLGLESFWAGVDVPGEACSVVVIDRLPFPTPDDPVLAAISKVDQNWFFNYSIPRSIIAFKQGFGRLIRSSGCLGAVVCLDNRLIEKKYGKQFLRSLPPVDKSTSLDSIVEWLKPGAVLPPLIEVVSELPWDALPDVHADLAWDAIPVVVVQPMPAHYDEEEIPF